MKARKVDKEQRRIVAVAQAYGEIDAWGDTFAPGCFDKCLEQKGEFKVVHNFDFSKVVGISKLTSNPEGLLADISLSNTEPANDALAFENPHVSIGFLVKEQNVSYPRPGESIREIQEAYVHVINVEDRPEC